MNYNYYEGKGINVNEIISLSDTMPFFADRRLILMEDSGWFKGGPGQMKCALYREYSGYDLSFVCGNGSR